MVYLTIIKILILFFLAENLFAQEFSLENEAYTTEELQEFFDEIGRNSIRDKRKIIKFIKKSKEISPELEKKLLNKDSLIDFIKNSGLIWDTEEFKKNFMIFLRHKTDFSADTNNKTLYDNNLRFRYSLENLNLAANIVQYNSFSTNLDFYSLFINYKYKNIDFILGDYKIEAGLGNLFGSEFSSGNSFISTTNLSENLNDTYGYSSNYNGKYFSGISISSDFSLAKNQYTKIQAFSSFRKKHGNIENDTIKSIYYGEIRPNKDVFNEFLFGINTSHQISSIKFGLISYFLNYSDIISTQSKSNLNGNSALLNSFYLIKELISGSIGAEFTLDNNQNIGSKIYLVNNNSLFDYSFGIRYFEENFISPFGVNNGSKVTPNNEIGLFSAMKIKTSDGLKIFSDLDIYKELSELSKNDLGWNFNINFERKFSSNLLSKLRIRISDKYSESQLINEDSLFSLNTILKIKSETIYKMNNSLDLSFVFDIINQFESQNTINKGVGLRIKLSYKYKDFLSVIFSSNLYSTDNYYTAIWYNERIHQNYYISQSNYLDGSKYGINIDCKISENVIFSLKYSSNFRIVSREVSKSDNLFGEIKFNI